MSPAGYRHIQTHTQDGVLVLTVLETELRSEDLTRAFSRELIDARTRSGAVDIVLDLKRVSYVASLGLSSLLTFRQHVRGAGGRLLLCNLSPNVADVLFATQLVSSTLSTRVPFALAADVPAAIDALRRGEGAG